MTEDEKYGIAVKLIGNGYLIHCTNAVFNEFDKSYIKGGSRAHEGYGFYFTDMAYKAISYGDIFKIIRKDDFNFLNSSAPIDTSLFYKDNGQIEQQIYKLEYYLDNARNNRDYNYYSNEIDKLKSQLSQNDDNLKAHIGGIYLWLVKKHINQVRFTRLEHMVLEKECLLLKVEKF